MAYAADEAVRDWSQTLFLPKTSFGMKAGLPQLEPKLLERWTKMNLYKLMRKTAKGREKFVLHDGPPYANGHIHIGTGLNKILKDAVTRSRQMMGKDSNYVPGWDCHGLPIEWKVEEQYRAKGKNKDEIPVNEFRRECREFAEKWIGVQMAEFRRLGVEGDWEHYYSTMAYEAEAVIASELMKFAMNGSLYRGSKPVMWSVVERTALAEAEVEYQEHASPAIWVKFPVLDGSDQRSLSLAGEGQGEGSRPNKKGSTPSPQASPHGRGERRRKHRHLDDDPLDHPRQPRDLVFEEDRIRPVRSLGRSGGQLDQDRRTLRAGEEASEPFFQAARVEKWTLVKDIDPTGIVAAHPLHEGGFDFKVPLLEGEHVTEDTGTGFVHTAPGHGADDFDIWTASTRHLQSLGINSDVPDTVGPDGYYRKHVPLFGGDEPKRVIDDKGHFGKLDDLRYGNAAVIAALKDADALAAMNPRHKHD